MWSTIPISEPPLSSLIILDSDVNGNSNINYLISELLGVFVCFVLLCFIFNPSSSAIQNDTNTMMGKCSVISKAYSQNQPNGF